MLMQNRPVIRLVTGVAIIMLMLGFVQAAAMAAPGMPPMLPSTPENLTVQAPRQIFSGDFKVERGQVVAENVVVYSGDVEIDEGGSISGSLVVMSGDVKINRGGNVEGDVAAYSGDIEIEGRVGGSVSSLSGNIDLGAAALVEGDLSVVSGRVYRAEGAYVGGNLVQTPGLRLPSIPDVPLPLGQAIVGAPRTSLLGQVLGLLARLVGAVLLTALVGAIAGVLYSVWPTTVARTRTTLETQRPLSFVVGFFGNLTLLFLIGMLSITICLLPLALIPLLALLAVNLVGWTVASQIVGERVMKSLKQEVQPVLVVAVGAVVLTGIATLLWALGGCFRPIGFLFMLGVASFGTGAVVVPWLNRRGSGQVTTAPATKEIVPPPPTTNLAVEDTAHADAAHDVVYDAVETVVTGDEAGSDVEESAGQPSESDATVSEDEFTRMRGVGPALESKLKTAGIRTFAQLAAASYEEIAEIVGWSTERVQRSELREQAQRFAEDA